VPLILRCLFFGGHAFSPSGVGDLLSALSASTIFPPRCTLRRSFLPPPPERTVIMIVVTRSRQVKGGFLLLIHCRLITNELMHCLVSVVWATTFFPRHPGTTAPGLRRKGLRSQELPAAREKARPKRGGRGKALKGCDTPLPGHGPYGAAAAAGAAPPCPRTGGGQTELVLESRLTSFFLVFR